MAILSPPLNLDETEQFIDRFLAGCRTNGVDPHAGGTGDLWMVGFVQGLQAAGVPVGDPYDPALEAFLARMLGKFASF